MATSKYKPQSYFFVDHTALRSVNDNDTNESVDAFGPVVGFPTTKYRTTSFVRASDSTASVKVFAICAGRVLIQPTSGSGNETKVNLILKPETNYAPLKIKYFIYRGVNKADLILNDTLVPINAADTSQPTFLKRLWSVYERYNNNSALSDFFTNMIGYAPSMSSATLIDEVFNQFEGDQYQLPVCEAGMHLGYFTERVGLDIVLDDGDYMLEHQEELFRFDLGYARKIEHVFDVSTISNATPAIETTKRARYREFILRFMDAAAFWGSHINCGKIALSCTVPLADETRIETASDIYGYILNKYQTRNNIYIHITGERNRSYTYYDDANNKRKIYFNDVEISYETSDWPIFIEKSTNASYPIVEKNILQLEYHIDNPVQSLVPPPNVTNRKKEYYFPIRKIERHISVDVIALNNNDTSGYPRLKRPASPKDINGNIDLNAEIKGRTDKIFVLFPICNSLYCSTLLIIYSNLRQTFPLEKYYNNLWCANIKSTLVLPYEEGLSYWCNCDKNVLQNFDETLSTGAAVQNLVYFDTGKKILNSTTTYKKRRLYIAALKSNTIHNTEYNNLNVENFTSCFYYNQTSSDYFLHLYGDGCSVFKGSFYEDDEPYPLLSLFHKKNLLKRKSYYQLGISEDEYNNLIAVLPADADNVFFHLEKGARPLNIDHVRRFRLGLRYENNNRAIVTQFPTTDIFVYTMDGCYFFSKEYADYQQFYEEFSETTLVELRTITNEYDGEFGYDWLRIGDNPSQNADPAYKNIIQGGYEKPNANDLNTEYESAYEAYKALVQEYFILPDYSNNYYAVPYLSLFSKEYHDKMQIEKGLELPYEANLRIIVNGIPNNRLEFDYEESLFEVSINEDDKKIITDNTVKITCLKDFAESKLIRIYDCIEGEDKKLAGVIFVNKNCDIPRKHLKFVFVKVRTDVDNNPTNNENGDDVPNERINLRNALYQSLITADMEESSVLDLSSVPDYRSGGRFVLSKKLFLNHPDFFQNLRNLFLSTPDNSKYAKGYFIVFIFGVLSNQDSVVGQVEYIGSRNIILLSSRGDGTLAHEALHGLGLYHIHREYTGNGFPKTGVVIIEPEKKYVYPNRNDPETGTQIDNLAKLTDNIMSYNANQRKSTWRWQWDIIRNNIR